MSGRVFWAFVSLYLAWCWLGSVGCEGWSRRDQLSVTEFVTVALELEVIEGCQGCRERERVEGRARVLAAHGHSSEAVQAFIRQRQADPDGWLAVEQEIVKRLDRQKRNMQAFDRTIGWRGFVIVPRAEVRMESRAAAPVTTALLLGEHVTVIGRREGWVQVRSTPVRTGWVAKDAVLPEMSKGSDE